MGLVKVALWYRGVTTGGQYARACGSPCTAWVEKPRRRFTGLARSRERERDGPCGRAHGEPPRHQVLEQRRRRLGRPQRLELAGPPSVAPLDQRRQPVARQHRLDRL